MQKLYSPASLGKSYFKDLNIEGFTKLNPDFDPTVTGAFLETFYGGRSDVRVRHQIVRVRVADFTSQYPSNNALMGLQELVTAEHIGVRRNDPEAIRFLQEVGLDDLQRKETWKKLRGIALVHPGDMGPDILPFRTMYGEKEDDAISTNIGVNKIVSACLCWYTFAHIIASKLLTGKTPKILKTLELFPIGRQKTKTIKLFNDDRYEVDLAKDDLFATLIDARIDYKNELENDATPRERKPFLNSIQNGLKITANGTSYGALLEFIADEHMDPVSTMVYFGEDSAKVTARARHVGVDGDVEISDYKSEKSGKYFAPYGTLIPAAGHLMLAIAETLAAERGLTYAFCDTDSMAFADYWNRYSDSEFDQKVREITNWFQPLNPYQHDIGMFNIEKVNYKLRTDGSGKTTKELEPLYCVAISAKRYCLFNLDKRGRPIIRKATAHGLGDVMLPTGYKSRFEHVAAPVVIGKTTKKPLIDGKTKKPKRVHGDLVAGSAAPLFLDMWMAAIKELQAVGNLDNIDNVIGTWPRTLDGPHHFQSSLGTRDAWMNYKSLPNRRPFQFMTCLSAPVLSFAPTWHHDFMQAEIEDACASSLYTAFSNPFTLDLDGLYRRDNNEPIKPYLDAGVVRLATVRDRIKAYFHHMEAKSEGVVGLLERKCVVGITKVWIGKESNPLADVEDLPDDETMEHYRTSGEIVTDSAINHDLIAFAGISEIAAAARVYEALLVDAVMGQKAVRKHASIRGLGPDAVNRIAAAINVNANGSIEIRQVPETRLETAMERARRILHKGKRLRELVKYIHSVTAGRVCLRAAVGETEATKRYEVDGPTHKQITHDIKFIHVLQPPKYLKLADIEQWAKDFYGFSKRLDRQTAKKQKMVEAREKSKSKAGMRRDNSRKTVRDREIKRVAGHWNMPEIERVKSIKHAHLIDERLNKIAAKGFKVKRIIFSTYIHGDGEDPA